MKDQYQSSIMKLVTELKSLPEFKDKDPVDVARDVILGLRVQLDLIQYCNSCGDHYFGRHSYYLKSTCEKCERKDF